MIDAWIRKASDNAVAIDRIADTDLQQRIAGIDALLQDALELATVSGVAPPYRQEPARAILRILLVTAHPLKTSLCAELARHVIADLQVAGHEVVIEDLYASGFNPVLTPDERRGYNGSSPTAGADVVAPIERLVAAEAIVLVFPVWWFGLPAILKGWLDRVWAPDVAFDHRDDAGVLKPRLTQLRHLLVIAAFGSPWWLDRFIMGRPVMKLFKRALLPSCATDCRFEIQSLHDTDHLQPARLVAFKKRVSVALKRLP